MTTTAERPIPIITAASLLGVPVAHVYQWTTEHRLTTYPLPRDKRPKHGRGPRRGCLLSAARDEYRRRQVCATSRRHNRQPMIAETMAHQAAYLRQTLPRCLAEMFVHGQPPGLVDALVARDRLAIRGFVAVGVRTAWESMSPAWCGWICCRAMLVGEFRPWSGRGGRR